MKNRLILLLVCLVTSACQVQPVPDVPAPTAQVITQTPPAPAILPTQTPAPTLPPAIQVSASELRGSVISLWHPLGDEQEKAIETIVADFNQNNIWGIQVQVSALHSLTALEEQILFNVSDRKLPQVVLAPPEVIHDWKSRLGIVADAEPYLADREWGLAEKEKEDLIPQFWLDHGDRISIPIQREAAVLFYNQSFAQELGFSNPPATPEDFRAQACAASRKSLQDDTFDNDGQGGWFLERDPLTLLSWMESFGAPPLDTASGQLKFNTQAALDTFTFLRRLLDSACAWTSKTATPGEAFAQRRALFFSGSSENILSQERIQVLNKSTDRWSLIAYPSAQNSPVVLTSAIDGAILTSQPAGQLASWLLLRWMLLPRSQAGLASSGAALPVRMSTLGLMEEFGKAHPQWAKLVNDFSLWSPEPNVPEWRIARRILEDAAWQMVQPYVPVTRFPAILAEVDSTLEELLKRRP